MLGLQACSAVRLGYDHAPELAYWWLDGYLDFDNGQARQVRASLDVLQDWHRREELPKVVALLQQAEQMVQREPDADEICSLADSLKTRARAVAERALPAMARLAPGLSVDQLETLRKKYLASNGEFRHDWVELSPGKRREKRVDQIVERVEKVYGPLGAPQRAAITASIARSAYDPALELEERKRRQADVMAQLRTVSTTTMTQQAVEQTLRAMIDRAFVSPDAHYRSYRETLLRQSCEGFATVQAVMSPHQRQAAFKQLTDYEQDARALAAEASP